MSRNETAQATRFRELILPHLDDAYSLARFLTRDASRADDVVQESCLRAFRHLDSLRNRDSRPWLLKIVRNCFYASLPRAAAGTADAPLDQGDGNEPLDDCDPADILAREHDRATVHEFINQLPTDFREVLVLRELHELSYREIADIVEIPMGTVMSRLARAREMLRQAWIAGTSTGVRP
jgi:RNA polymerase sigma-70 factor (ECF subfamily)